MIHEYNDDFPSYCQYVKIINDMIKKYDKKYKKMYKKYKKYIFSNNYYN